MPPPRLSRRFDNRPGFWKRRRREALLLFAVIACALIWKALAPEKNLPNTFANRPIPAETKQLSLPVDSTLWQSAELIGPADLIDSLSSLDAIAEGEAEALAHSDKRLIFMRRALNGSVFRTGSSNTVNQQQGEP